MASVSGWQSFRDMHETRKPTPSKGSKMTPPPGVQIYMPVRVTLTSDLLTPKLTVSCPCSVEDVCRRHKNLCKRFFYRATRMHSTVCMSVCHTPVYYEHRWTYPHFYHQVAHHSSFSTPNGMAIFRRGPLKAASNVRCMKKNHNFQPVSRFISEMMQDKTIVTTNGE